MQPFQAQRQLLQQIPGVDALVAATIIAEIGIDMSVFGNARRLAAWAGVCPGNHESAGKRKSGATRRGNVHLKTALVTAAVCASRQKGSYYKDKYHRLRARRGRLRAAMAIAHKILIAAYHMLAGGVPYRELGEAFLDQQARQRTVRHLLHRLNHLGYDVMLAKTPRRGQGGLFRGRLGRFCTVQPPPNPPPIAPPPLRSPVWSGRPPRSRLAALHRLHRARHPPHLVPGHPHRPVAATA